MLFRSITTPKIQDVSVTSSKLADSAIISSKIADGAITSSKIADGAITSTDLNATLDLSSKTITLSVSTLGIPGTQTNPFKSIAQAQFFGVQRGLYYFTNGTLTQQLYYDHADGGWILISSSNSSDSTFPGGTSRNSTTYYVNRNGTAGSTGTISPNNDYLIGSWLDASNLRNRVYQLEQENELMRIALEDIQRMDTEGRIGWIAQETLENTKKY